MIDGVDFILDGRTYNFSPGFGVQLFSVEKKPVPKGTVRFIGDRLFTVFNSNPVYLWRNILLGPLKQYEIGWTMIPNTGKRIENKDIESLKKYLQSLV